jgi:chemotaxis signal transduction protein
MTGLIVSEVLNVNAVPTEQIAKPYDFFPAVLDSVPILQGIVKTGEGTAMLLDLDHLFDAGQTALTGYA